MASVYVAPEVRDVERLHAALLVPGYNALTIRAQLDGQARNLVDAHARSDKAVAMQLQSWWPPAPHLAIDQILRTPFSLDDARLSMAREYGFRDWAEVDALGDARPDEAFEDAVDALVGGDPAELMRMLDAAPDLVRARSRYGHGATLLHYVGANGVESYRQKTPLDIVEITRDLLARGADVSATAGMYGGGQTVLGLVATSAHPAAAGVQDALVHLLRQSGAK